VFSTPNLQSDSIGDELPTDEFQRADRPAAATVARDCDVVIHETRETSPIYVQTVPAVGVAGLEPRVAQQVRAGRGEVTGASSQATPDRCETTR
jgi:hypothetical protein